MFLIKGGGGFTAWLSALLAKHWKSPAHKHWAPPIRGSLTFYNPDLGDQTLKSFCHESFAKESNNRFCPRRQRSHSTSDVWDTKSPRPVLSSVQLSQKNYLEKTAKNLEMQSLPEILNVSVRSKARGTSGMLEAAVGLCGSWPQNSGT